MMMECPRCGFSQPKDQFCANCGLNIEQFLKKPKPFWIRLAQNPNLHLSLIGILVVVIIGYIFYSQRGLVARQMNALLTGTPLSSREAAVKPRRAAKPVVHEPVAPSKPINENKAVEAQAVAPAPPPPPAAEKPPEVQKIEVSYWEIGREDLNALIEGAEKVSDGNAGRAYEWTKDAHKMADAIQGKSRRITVSRTIPAQSGSQLSVETPATASEAFQFGLYFQVSRPDGATAASKDYSIKWDSTLVLPQADNGQAVGSAPAVRGLTESPFSGTVSIGPNTLVMLVYEPPNRTPRQEYVARAGEGPWSIFLSDAFRAGASDWIVLLQMK